MVGFVSVLRHNAIRIFFASLVVLASGLIASAGRPPATANADCAFPFTPTAYEDLKNRRLFLDTIELAAFNMLFPGDPYFGLPMLENGSRQQRNAEAPRVPPTLLKSIAWIESSITQAGVDIPFGSIGPSLISFDCGHGITQVTTGMTTPQGESGRGSPEQALVATNFTYNIARGARILAEKWNEAPERRPIAGTDTGGSPLVVENWYFAVWGYNGFTGPGANRSNHPMDPVYGSWPRAAFSCGETGDGKGHNRANYPYQELVFGCAAHPPIVDGQPLWQALPVTLPDLRNDFWRLPLQLQNFSFPYANMDIRTPQPFHADSTPPPNAALREIILGTPRMEISTTDVKIGVAPGSGSTAETLSIANTGTGVMTWYAVATEPWIRITPYTGIAVGSERPCEPDVPCERNGKIEISVDATRAPPGKRQVAIRVQALGTNQSTIINVEVSQVIRLGVPGVTKN